MTQIDVAHHKIIGLLIALGVFILGVFFGVRVGTAAGSEGLLVMLFALALLAVVLLIVLFVQIVHIRDEIATEARGRVRIKVKSR